MQDSERVTSINETVAWLVLCLSGVDIRSVPPDTVPSLSLALMIASASGHLDSTRLGALMACMSMLAWEVVTGFERRRVAVQGMVALIV